MITKDELEILRGISAKDVKKYRPELFSDNKKEKAYIEKTAPSEIKNGSKENASFLFVLLVFVSEVALFFGVILNVTEHLSLGGILHYFFFVCAGMCSLWGFLPDGKLNKTCQVLVFSVIPLCEFILIQLLGLSNWWGLLFFFVYAVILGIVFKMDFDEGTSYRHSNVEKYKEAFLTGLLKGLIK